MSKKTLEDSVSQHERTAKTPDLIEFSTADKLTFLSETENTEVTRKDKTYHTNTPESPRGKHTTTSKATNSSDCCKKQQNNPKDEGDEPRTTASKHPPKNSRLSIVTYLKSGLRPSKICVKLGITNSTLQYHLNILKNQGIIKKVGYGTWEVTDQPEILKKTTARIPYVGKKQPREEIQKNLFEYIPESIRGHGFVWTVEVPTNMHNWSNKKREQYLDRHNIHYKKLRIFGGGQSLIIKGHRVWLTNKSIVVYDTDSYFAETAIAAKSTAINSLLSIIRNIERLLHADFTIGNSWKFKPSRRHYAIIKSKLAEHYDKEGKKLEVRTSDDNSLWLWIDNSYRLHETETGHHITAEEDNTKIQNLLNSVRDTGANMHTILELNHGLQQLFAGLQEVQATSVIDQAAFASDLRTHVDVQKATASLQRETTATLKKVADGVQDLTAATKELTKAVENRGESH